MRGALVPYWHTRVRGSVAIYNPDSSGCGQGSLASANVKFSNGSTIVSFSYMSHTLQCAAGRLFSSG